MADGARPTVDVEAPASRHRTTAPDDSRAGARGAPDSASHDDAPVETRRERQRRETVEEIKTAARQHLTLESSSQLSLRAVARDVGLTPSAIYRYFQSQQELVGAVAHDAFASATAAMREAAEASEGAGPAEQLTAIAHAYRAWATSHKAEFNLMFNTDMPELVRGPSAVDTDTLGAFFAIPLDLYARGVQAGEIDTSSTVSAAPASITPRVLSWIEAAYPDITVGDLNLLLSAWSAFHGFVVLELFGHLSRFYDDESAAFDRHLQEVLARMGLRVAPGR